MWRSYCRCADTTDRLLQMLTMFDQHDQYPCKEGRESSEEKPTRHLGLGESRETHSPGSIIAGQGGGSIFNPGPLTRMRLCHNSDQIPIPGTLCSSHHPSWGKAPVATHSAAQKEIKSLVDRKLPAQPVPPAPTCKKYGVREQGKGQASEAPCPQQESSFAHSSHAAGEALSL